MKLVKIYFVAVLIAILFFGCKKYPENKLWFKKPQDVFKGGKITSYTVNGVDQKPYYRNLYYGFPYNLYGKSIEDVFELPFSYDSGSEEFTSEYGEGSLHFSKTGKEVEISFTPIKQEYGAENIFVGRFSWKVLRLTKDGVMKVQAKENFKVYEIQFN
jgi:hypothetical protein